MNSMIAEMDGLSSLYRLPSVNAIPDGQWVSNADGISVLFDFIPGSSCFPPSPYTARFALDRQEALKSGTRSMQSTHLLVLVAL